MNHRLMSLAVASVAALAISAPAMAQEDWSGLYVGANLGGSWGDTRLDLEAGTATGPAAIPPADLGLLNRLGSEDDNKTSFTGGVQGGYNYQMGSIVLGIETDFGFFDLDQGRTNAFQSAVNPGIGYALDQRVKTEWIWTLRPRIGFAFDQFMVYATGGIATSKIEFKTRFVDNRNPQNIVELDNSDTDTGWVGGVGGAYALSPNWSVRGEWLYADFGKVHETVTGPAGFVTITPEAKVRTNLVRVGVDYRF